MPPGAVTVEFAELRGKSDRARFKAPKSKNGIRTISLPTSVIDALKAHRRQPEQRIDLWLGKPGKGALVFCGPEGTQVSPAGNYEQQTQQCRVKCVQTTGKPYPMCVYDCSHNSEAYD